MAHIAVIIIDGLLDSSGIEANEVNIEQRINNQFEMIFNPILEYLLVGKGKLFFLQLTLSADSANKEPITNGMLINIHIPANTANPEVTVTLVSSTVAVPIVENIVINESITLHPTK